MLGTLVLAMSGLIAVSEGLHDEAVVAFPGVLIFASMFGSRRVFVSLLLIILTGIHVQTVQPLALGRLLNLASILALPPFLCGYWPVTCAAPWTGWRLTNKALWNPTPA